MPQENIIAQDGSNDRKFFTIVPNYVLNHSSANDQSLYLQMKRLAGDNGKCYAGMKYFCERMQVTRNTVRKSLEYLLKHGWITFAGKEKVETDGGMQEMNSYIVNDIWKINTDYYAEKSKGGENSTPLAKEGENSIPLEPKGGERLGQRGVNKGGENNTTNNIYITKNIGFKKEPIAEKKFEPDDYALTDALEGRIRANLDALRGVAGANAGRALRGFDREAWAWHVHKLRTADGWTTEQVRYVIDWCQQDSFWQGNILSAKKLREKFPQLVLRVKAQAEERQRKYGVTKV